MTIGALIERLEKYNKNMKVMIRTDIRTHKPVTRTTKIYAHPRSFGITGDHEIMEVVSIEPEDI